MKSIFIAGSRRFYSEIEALVGRLEAAGFVVKTAGKVKYFEKDTLENQKAALLRAFERIDASDILYVFSKGGYVGRTVAMEVAYAYSKGKEIVSSCEISELSVRALVSKVVSVEDFVQVS
jgi:hypothetical protein